MCFVQLCISLNIFDLQLVKSMYTKPMDRESRLRLKRPPSKMWKMRFREAQGFAEVHPS